MCQILPNSAVFCTHAPTPNHSRHTPLPLPSLLGSESALPPPCPRTGRGRAEPAPAIFGDWGRPYLQGAEDLSPVATPPFGPPEHSGPALKQAELRSLGFEKKTWHWRGAGAQAGLPGLCTQAASLLPGGLAERGSLLSRQATRAGHWAGREQCPHTRQEVLCPSSPSTARAAGGGEASSFPGAQADPPHSSLHKRGLSTGVGPHTELGPGDAAVLHMGKTLSSRGLYLLAW